MTLDDTIKQVLEIAKKQEMGIHITQERAYAPLLARACQRMKEALMEMGKPHLSRQATYELDRRSNLCLGVLADVKKMFGGGRGNVL